jgi:hydroxymethylpyrimidine/phosphomethylpyrimidine kinase
VEEPVQHRADHAQLAGLELQTLEDMREAARRIHRLGPKAVLVKGGAMAGPLRGTDIWFDGERMKILHLGAVETRNTHGTGCTLSAAIAANLALGHELFEATRLAKEYVTRALQHPLAVGRGNGPIGHFFPLLGD